MRKNFLVLLCIALNACVTPGSIKPTDLREFTTDACSHYPNGTRTSPALWAACCVEHDKAYWAGGMRSARAVSDDDLKQCVEQSGGGKLRAKLMWLGVRFAGAPWYPSHYRWAYGWPYFRGYKPITAEEQLEIDRNGML